MCSLLNIVSVFIVLLIVCVCFQSKLQECQKRLGEMEAELQRANNKVCHTGHQVNQLTTKVKKKDLYP